MRLDELAEIMNVPTEDLLGSIVKQARIQEGFDFDPDLPDEVLEQLVVSLEIPEASNKRNGTPGGTTSSEREAEVRSAGEILPDATAFWLGLIVDIVGPENSEARDPADFRDLGNRFARDAFEFFRRLLRAILRTLTVLLDRLSLTRGFVLLPGF